MALSACGGNDADKAPTGPPESASADEWDTIVDKAKDEGEVIIYSSHSGTLEAFPKFEEKYPDIKVTITRLPTSDLLSRLDQELAADAQGADVVFTSDPIWFAERDDEKNLASVNLSPEAVEAGWEDRLDGNNFATTYSYPYTIAYNTSTVERPESLDQLIDVAGDAKVGLTDPSAAIATTYQWDVWMQTYGDDLIERVSELNYSTDPSATALGQLLGSGDLDYAFPMAAGVIPALQAEGAPVDEVLPEGRLSGPVYPAGALANAPNPNAAQVFLDWLMSADAEKLFVDTLGPASVPLDVPGSIPWGDIEAYDSGEWSKEAWDQWIADNWQPEFDN